MSTGEREYCEHCGKVLAHTLGTMGYAGPPFWCECRKYEVRGGIVYKSDQQRIIELEQQVHLLKNEMKNLQHDLNNARAAAHMLMERAKCGN